MSRQEHDIVRQVLHAQKDSYAADVRWESAELDRDDGKAIYELEFRTGSTEYRAEVHAETGKILDFEVDRDD